MTPTQGEHAQTEALLPCPFCGASAHFETDSDGWHWIECESCGMQGNRSASLMEDCKPKLLEAWNTRAGVHPDVASGYAKGWEDGMSEATALLTPAQPAAPQGVAYAELPEPAAWRWKRRHTDKWTYAEWDGIEAEAAQQMRDQGYYAVELLDLRASNGQAPATQQTLERNAVPAEWLEQAYREGWAACRDAETIGGESEDWSFGNSTANSRMIDAQQAAPQPAPTAQEAPAAGAVAGPDGRMSHELRRMIEGMSVSVDVSTGDHDAGHRYFGTVTEVMDCNGDKHGVTLLVQDAEPNFAPTPAAQADSQPSSFGSPELQAMILARCVEKDKADSVLEDAALATLFTTPAQRREMAGDGKPCNNDHDPDCRWPDCICRHREAQFDAARKQGAKHG